MVLLVHGFNKFCANHRRHRHDSEALGASYLQAFVSEVSSFLNQLPPNPDSVMSFPWILHFLHVLPNVHEAFAKLVMNLEYPFAKWDEGLTSGYLNYSLNLLDFFNSISSSLSQLGHSRVLLSHALNLLDTSPSPSSALKFLKPIEPKGFREFEVKETEGGERNCRSGKDWVIRQALMVMEGIGYWVCGTVISGLRGDSMAYLETRKSAGCLMIPSFKRLDLRIFKEVTEKGSMMKEITEMNDKAAQLVAAVVTGKSSGGAPEEMKRRLESLEKELASMGKEVDSQFSEVLGMRTKLLDVFRQRNH